MSSVHVRASRSLAGMTGCLDDLKDRLGQLGLAMHLWDRSGRAVGDFRPPWEFCRALSEAGVECTEWMGELARRVAADGAAARQTAGCGCCLVGVPLRERRRLLGAATACFPPRELLDSDDLARLCDRLPLDRQALRELAAGLCRHSAAEAEDYLRVLAWMLQQEQGTKTAREELATLSANLATTYEELSLLYRISGSMRVTQRSAEFLQGVCQELLEVMNISAAAAVVYPRPPRTDDDRVVISGDLDLNRQQLRMLVSACVAPRFEGANRVLLDNAFAAPPESGLGQGVRNLLAVSLVSDSPLGALVALNKRSGEFDSVDMKLISSIGSQASVFLANHRLYEDLEDLMMGVLHALTASIDAKDPYTCGHSQRVSLLSRRMAEAMGLPPAKVQQIHLCGLLHDVGKIGIPESILLKTGRLTEEEFRDIKRHPAIGARILGGIRHLDDAIAGILTHHERPDGKGYPQGLRGKEIPVEGRIVGLADSFDAMTSDRTYRKALPVHDALEEIRRNIGAQFDPDVAWTFLSIDIVGLMEQLRSPARGGLPVRIVLEGKP